MAKPRKKYRPRGVSTNPLQIAIQGVAFLSSHDIEIRVRPVRQAVDLIRTGKAGKEHWQALFDALNMIEQFSQMPGIIDGDTRAWVEAQQATIVAILDRQREGKRALYAAEIDDLDALADMWESVLTNVTHRQYFEAEEATHKRLVAILRSKTPGVRVLKVVDVAEAA